MSSREEEAKTNNCLIHETTWIMEILFIFFSLEETHAVADALPEWPVGLAAWRMLHASIAVSILYG